MLYYLIPYIELRHNFVVLKFIPNVFAHLDQLPD